MTAFNLDEAIRHRETVIHNDIVQYLANIYSSNQKSIEDYIKITERLEQESAKIKEFGNNRKTLISQDEVNKFLDSFEGNINRNLHYRPTDFSKLEVSSILATNSITASNLRVG